jgi:hypothetical protein
MDRAAMPCGCSDLVQPEYGANIMKRVLWICAVVAGLQVVGLGNAVASTIFTLGGGTSKVTISLSSDDFFGGYSTSAVYSLDTYPANGEVMLVDGLLAMPGSGVINPTFARLTTSRLPANEIKIFSEIGSYFTGPFESKVARANASYRMGIGINQSQIFYLSLRNEHEDCNWIINCSFFSFKLSTADGTTLVSWSDSLGGQEANSDYSLVIALGAGDYVIEGLAQSFADKEGSSGGRGWQQLIMTPIPEPSTWNLMALGLILACMKILRKPARG